MPQPAEPPLAWTEVVLGGRSCRFCGPADDVYFQHLVDAAATAGPLLAIGRAVLPADGVVVDAGANLGITAAALAPLVPRGRLHAFEPVPAMQRCLAANLALNAPGNTVVLPCALSDQVGELALYEGPGFAAGSHVITPDYANPGVPVRMLAATTLDAFAEASGLTRLDLLKVDVEGFEAEVLRGGAATLRRFRPVVHLEFNSFPLIVFRNRSPRAFVEELQAMFRHVIWLDATGQPRRITPGQALHTFLHDHIVHRRSIDDLVCCDDDGWLARYVP